jgi:hypothetical protein
LDWLHSGFVGAWGLAVCWLLVFAGVQILLAWRLEIVGVQGLLSLWGGWRLGVACTLILLELYVYW